MNRIQLLHTEYIRPNRTIETILIYKNTLEKLLWIYNYEGIHFRVFDKKDDISNFFHSEVEPTYSFDDECELDSFLKMITLIKRQVFNN